MTEPRDESLELLLRQSVRRSGDAGATSSCLDAETIAAWLDGGLSDEEAVAAEAHAAVCEHCRALAAVIVRHQAPEPHAGVVAPADSDAPRPRRRFGWIAPLGVAAVLALAIWIPRRGPSSEPESTVAIVPPPAAALPRQAPLPAASPEAALESARTGGLQGSPSRDLLMRPDAAPSAAAAEALPQVRPAPPQTVPPEPAPTVAPRQEAAGAATARIPAEMEKLAFTETVVTGFQAPLTTAFVAGGAGARGAQAGQGDGTGPPAGQGAAGAGRGGRGSGAGAIAADTGSPAFRTAATTIDPSRPPQWRVLSTGAVERSNPSGAPWERIAIEPAGIRITNGSAPNPFVCWLVGRAGAVLLSLDAQTFTRLPFPEVADLVSVQAANARMATVTASDGRTFTTTDGGQTWRRD